MKELTIEQKAARYDEILARGKCELQDTDNKDLYELAKKTWL